MKIKLKRTLFIYPSLSLPFPFPTLRYIIDQFEYNPIYFAIFARRTPSSSGC